MNTITLFVASFLLGSIPTAYLFAKALKKIDIREHGSGNVGATNVSRVLGKKYGVVVFVIDFLKGALAVLIVLAFAQKPTNQELSLWIGSGSILGHIFTPFLGFKGGKGVATGAGVLCAVYPLLFILTFLVWWLVFILTKIVSISSVIAMCSLVIFSYLTYENLKISIFFGLILLLFLWTHRSNLLRLVMGKENKIS